MNATKTRERGTASVRHLSPCLSVALPTEKALITDRFGSMANALTSPFGGLYVSIESPGKPPVFVHLTAQDILDVVRWLNGWTTYHFGTSARLTRNGFHLGDIAETGMELTLVYDFGGAAVAGLIATGNWFEGDPADPDDQDVIVCGTAQIELTLQDARTLEDTLARGYLDALSASLGAR